MLRHRKRLVVAVSLVLALVAAEIGLRIVQRRLGQNLDGMIRDDLAAASVRVLAVGNTSTALAGGAAETFLRRDTAYPAQLETILNARQAGRTFVVINEGAAGGDSDRIVERLESQLQNYRPHMLIVMMGMGDQAPAASADSLRDPSAARWLSELGVVRAAGWLGGGLDFATALSPVPTSFARQLDREVFAHFFRTDLTPLSRGAWRDVQRAARLALYHQLTGRFAKAETLAHMLIERWGVGQNLLASLHLAQGQFEPAIDLLKATTDQHPQASGHLVYLASAYRGMGNEIEAERILVKAAQLDPLEVRALVGLAELDAARGRYDAAVQRLSACGQGASSTYEAMKRDAPASQLDSTGLALDLVRHCQMTLAQLLYRRGSKAGAEKIMKAVLAHKYQFAAAQLLGQLYRERGEWEQEAALWQKYADESRRWREYYEAAKAYAHLNQNDKLTALFEQARRAVPKTADNYRAVYQAAKRHDVTLLFMQYPGLPLDLLKGFVPHEALSDPRVHFIDNEHVFAKQARSNTVVEAPYPNVFETYTQLGAQLLADHIATHVLALPAPTAAP